MGLELGSGSKEEEEVQGRQQVNLSECSDAGVRAREEAGLCLAGRLRFSTRHEEKQCHESEKPEGPQGRRRGDMGVGVQHGVWRW